MKQTHYSRECRVVKLSVSSNGSNAVKHFAKDMHVRALVTFSILKRIECGETIYYNNGKAYRKNFQYPQTDRMR